MTSGATPHSGVRGAARSAASVPDQQGRTHWRRTMSQAWGAVDVSVPTDTHIDSVRTVPLGRLRVVTVEGDGMTVRRTHRRTAGGDGDGFVILNLLDTGVARVEQDGREAQVHPSDIFIYETTRPVRVDFSRFFRVKSLVLPHEELRRRGSAVARITAAPFGPDTSLGRLLSPFITRLVDSAETFLPTTGELMARNMVNLLGALVDESLGRADEQAQGKDWTLMPRIQAFIEEHLSDPALSPARIAQAHHVSLRYLYKMFQAEGITVSRWILQRRLEACRRDLLHHQTRDLTIAAVAHQRGFASAAHFSRTFRTVYGMSPSEWRASQQAPGPALPRHRELRETRAGVTAVKQAVPSGDSPCSSSSRSTP
ncbi:helix-turn-helix domain-containing protein [Streptomyces sp. NPDC001732]